MGPDGEPLPWQTAEEVETFLQKASIGRSKSTDRGVTRPTRMELVWQGVKANAIFHEIDEEKRFVQLKDGQVITDFRDSYLFQVAAYRLSRMVGLENVPPSVKRYVAGRPGSMTLWIEGVITDEMRRAQNLEPRGEARVRWERQMIIMRVWDALIFNFDRNQGNILLDLQWNAWLIDHTRAFRRNADIEDMLRNIGSCDRKLYENIRRLNEQEVRQRLRGLLRDSEFEALFKRRAKVLAHLERLARERGEDSVFFDYL